MTLLGKIFTMLIFLMSIVYMAFSVMTFATHKNWKESAIALKADVDSARAERDSMKGELQTLITELEKERAARRMALQQLQSKQNLLTVELRAKEAELSEKLAQNSEYLQRMETAEAMLTNLTEEANNLRGEIRIVQADRDVQFQKVVELSDKLHSNEGTRRRLEERRDQLAHQVAELERVMRARGFTVHDPIENIPPKVDGYITQVSSKNTDVVEISLGTDDGIRVGHEMIVYRDKSYLAKVVIRKVDSNFCVAEIIKDTRRGSIRKGDNVTTRLS